MRMLSASARCYSALGQPRTLYNALLSLFRRRLSPLLHQDPETIMREHRLGVRIESPPDRGGHALANLDLLHHALWLCVCEAMPAMPMRTCPGALAPTCGHEREGPCTAAQPSWMLSMSCSILLAAVHRLGVPIQFLSQPGGHVSNDLNALRTTLWPCL